MVKIDSNRKIQGYISNTNVDFKLLGHTIGSDPVYFAQPSDISPIGLNVWTTIDVSSLVSADANGVILFVSHEDDSKKKYKFRAVGGTEQAKDKINNYSSTFFFVGLDSEKRFEASIEKPETRVYLVGETQGSLGFYATEVFVADPTLGSWQEQDADDYGIPTAANGLILHFDGEGGDTDLIGFRHGDSTDDWNKNIDNDTHQMAAIGLRSSDNVWDEYKGDNKVEVWISAYTNLTDLDVKANIDVIVRKSDDTIRSTLLTNVGDTALLTSDSWATTTITFAFPGYTVVDTTDYLEIDIYAEATSNNSAGPVSVEFRIDDPTLPIADQMKIGEVVP